VRLINTMILEAQAQGVSDIHIECRPGARRCVVRFRKDGVMRPYLELPPSYRNALVARIKIMCDLDIAERRKPQDGKITFGKFVQGQKLELRVATIPTNNNCEDAVLRLLASAKPLPLDKLNLSPPTCSACRPPAAALRHDPVRGPHRLGQDHHAALGAGLHQHARAQDLDRRGPDRDHPAGPAPGAGQPAIDWTFAKALRAFLRADPDVIMVGEIRDKETAGMAIEASLTGHLVMSTLHTNSAAETVTRLLDMGMDPFNFADALLVVLAQRLVRRCARSCVTHPRRRHARRGRGAAGRLHARLPRRRGRAVRGRGAGRLAPALRPRRPAAAPRGQGLRPVRRQRLPRPRRRARADAHDARLRHLIQTGGRPRRSSTPRWPKACARCARTASRRCWAGVTSIGEVRATTNA
jgi:hypothetical protein